MTLKLYNTLTRQENEFRAQDPAGHVTIYTCGPTVYSKLTVGNWAAYIYWDTLIRVLLANDYIPQRVMNITDVGHLTSDEDEGEDKLQKGARREGKTAWQVAEFYAEDFLLGMEKLGLIAPEHIVRATDYIPQQLDLIRRLKEKGYTYQTSDGIYFDTAKFPSYANFAMLDLAALKAGARVEQNPEKRNPSDFALWKFSPTTEKRDMEWQTPANLLEGAVESAGGAAQGSAQNSLTNKQKILGAEVATGPSDSDLRADFSKEKSKDKSGNSNAVMGFPGWHLECSTMALSILGDTLDIHTGGIDHIPVHHTNEIAQSEAATGKRFANYWLHNNHLKVDGTKISKSLGNGYTLDELEAKGFSPMNYRMFVLQGHFQGEGNFTFENLEAAQNRLAHWREIAELRHQIHDGLKDENDSDVPSPALSGALLEALNDNLNTPKALQLVDEAFSVIESTPLDKLNHNYLIEILHTIDDLLGLQLLSSSPDITEADKRLLAARSEARMQKDWPTSDHIRDELSKKGILVRDTPNGQIWSRTK